MVVVSLPEWKPVAVTKGAGLQTYTWLGALMSISAMHGRMCNPDDGPFKGVEVPRVTPELDSTIKLLRTQSKSYQSTLHSIVLALLSSRDCKPHVLAWIEDVIKLNTERSNLQFLQQRQHMDTTLDDDTADDGFMFNFSAVMLALCEKYANPKGGDGANWPPSFDKIDHE